MVATDRDPAAPGLALADAGEVVDVADWQGNLAVARAHRVDLVTSDQTDLAVLTVARVAEAMGLAGPGVAAALNCTDKERMRRACAAAGLPVPAFARVARPAAAVAFGLAHGWPIVLKPADAQSSRGVSRVAGPDQVAAGFAAARAASRSGAVLAEAWLEGTELTAEGFFNSDGSFVTLGISEKTHIPGNPCVADSLRYPARADLGAVAAANAAVASALGVRMGITHAEFILTARGPVLVEMANRGGGTRISSDIVPLLCGVEPDRALLRQAAGDRVVLAPRPWRAAALEFFLVPTGRLRAVAGLEAARAMPGVHALELAVAPGQDVAPPGDDRGRHGFAIVEAGSRTELDRRVRRLRQTVRFTVQAA